MLLEKLRKYITRLARNVRSKRVRAGWVMEGAGVVLDMSHLPEERLVDKLVGRADNSIGVLHLRYRFPLSLPEIDDGGMHQLLFRSVNCYCHCRRNQSKHHINWCILSLHAVSPIILFFEQINRFH